MPQPLLLACMSTRSARIVSSESSFLSLCPYFLTLQLFHVLLCYVCEHDLLDTLEYMRYFQSPSFPMCHLPRHLPSQFFRLFIVSIKCYPLIQAALVNVLFFKLCQQMLSGKVLHLLGSTEAEKQRQILEPIIHEATRPIQEDHYNSLRIRSVLIFQVLTTCIRNLCCQFQGQGGVANSNKVR